MSEAIEINPIVQKQLENKTDYYKDDIEVAIEGERATLAPRSSFVNNDGEIIFPNNGNITFLEYLRLAEAYELKIRRQCGKLANPERDEDDEFLESTHLILYKWHDYFSFPKKFGSKWLFGAQKKFENGEYDPEDNDRFLFGFRDADAFFIVFLSYVILFAELAILIGIVNELVGSGCSSRQSQDVTSLSVQLCTLYAASVASNSYFRFFPFEVTGQTPAGFCVLTQASLLRGETKIPTYFNSLSIFQKDIEKVGKDKTDAEAQSLILLYAAENVINDLIVFATTLALQVCNGLLLTTVAIVMATSPDLLSLIQNFVSVEIVVHIHEFVPKALRIVDRSPNRFNASYVDVSLFSTIIMYTYRFPFYFTLIAYVFLVV